jgi:membrane-bound serine protease (ClpP class)
VPPPRTSSATSRHRSAAGALRSAVLLATLLTGLIAFAAGGLAQETAGPVVATTEVDGPITPVIANHLEDTIADSAAAGHEALVVRLDTPGGGLDPTRAIVRSFLDAPLPVIVYVAPRGADAGSAGTFITYAAHLAAMAPATTIGAATPVDMEG